MATNFEFYKDEILKCLSENNIAIKNNKPVKCVGDCNSCIRDSEIGICMDKPFFEWLCAEHIEQPKLTKRERAFCEVVQTGWIARDKSGDLYWYGDCEPVKNGASWTREKEHVKRLKEFNEINEAWGIFGFIKWKDEKPWSIEDLLKLEAIEEGQHETT